MSEKQNKALALDPRAIKVNAELAKDRSTRKSQVAMALSPDELRSTESLAKAEQAEDSGKASSSMQKFILKSLEQQEVSRLAFETDPVQNNNGFGGFYRLKNSLTPNWIIKKVTGPGGCEQVAQVITARANIISSFGRPRASRFTTGFEFKPIDPKWELQNESESDKSRDKIAKLKETIWNCGKTGVDDDYYSPNLSQYLKMITKDGLSFGMFATEVIWQVNPRTGKKEAHSFRAVDSGTIYRVIAKREADQSVRREAIALLSNLKNDKIDIPTFESDAYKWVQVIDGRPVQAFTEDELIVYYLYPSTAVEYNGYPITPIDMAINAITTNINITQHNRLYFQNGRAAKGMIVIKSDDIDEKVLQTIRLQFQQSINSSNNSWRMPTFGIGPQDELTWQAIDTAGRDAEFQYLMDSNIRSILSAFLMSPEELPGLAHLSRGTNTQSLSESSSEYKLTAARDVGLRPLLNDIQDFFNTHLLPKFDAEIMNRYQFILAGLEQDDAEKEATRLTQDIPLHMTYNDVMRRVEKDIMPKVIGGDFPMNPQFQQILNTYLTFGEILEFFFDRKGAAKDPRYQFYQSPMWFQQQQILLQKAQLALQNQQMAQQMAQQQQMAAQQSQLADQSQEQPPSPPMGKSEKEMGEWFAKNDAYLKQTINDNSREIQKLILKRHSDFVKNTVGKFKKDAENAVEEIADIVAPKKAEE